jgi:hypothetical protein
VPGSYFRAEKVRPRIQLSKYSDAAARLSVRRMESDFASSVTPVLLRRQPALRPALRANIQRFGVLVPVVRDQHGWMIDGSHRARSDRVFS